MIVNLRLITLEKNECIVGHSERDGNRPERMVFNITDKGREVLRKEVLKHLTGFNDDPRTLGFAFLYGAENKEVIRTLEVHERRLVQEIENLEKMIAEEPRPTLYPEGPFLNCMSRPQLHEPRPHLGGTQVRACRHRHFARPGPQQETRWILLHQFR